MITCFWDADFGTYSQNRIRTPRLQFFQNQTLTMRWVGLNSDSITSPPSYQHRQTIIDKSSHQRGYYHLSNDAAQTTICHLEEVSEYNVKLDGFKELDSINVMRDHCLCDIYLSILISEGAFPLMFFCTSKKKSCKHNPVSVSEKDVSLIWNLNDLVVQDDHPK